MPHLKLFHFDIPTWGNYGDKALFPVVRDAFRVLGSGGPGSASSGAFDFTSAAALRREVDTALVDRINARADAVVVGGGGLFLQDTNPNRLSGWQWKISAEALAAIEVPLIIYALGDNRFPGQPEFDELMRSHVSQVLDQSVFFGLRNTGSIETMTKFLGHDPDPASGPIRFQPCPTTIAGLLYEPLLSRRPDPAQKVLAIQMLVHPRQQAAGFDAEVIHQATVDAARMLVAKGWTVLSVPFHPDDAEVSRKLVAEVPEVEEVRLYGPEVGFFAGFDLFASIPYVLGGRGHAQMIPFGVGSVPISLDLHAKLGYFARDIDHPEFLVPVGPEGLTAQHHDGNVGSSVTQRAQVLAERIVDTIEQAHRQGNELQADLESTRQDFWDITRANHAAIQDALHPTAATPPPAAPNPSPAAVSPLHPGDRLRTVSDIQVEEFHLAAVAEAEEFSAAQTRGFSQTRREHKQALDDERRLATTLRQGFASEREELREESRQQAAELKTRSEENRRLAEHGVELANQLDARTEQLRAVTNRTAPAEAKILFDKTAHGLKWRLARLVRKIRR